MTQLLERLSPKRRTMLLVAAVVAVVVLAYGASVGAAYVWDDDMLVAKDMRCRADAFQCFRLPFFPPSPFLDMPRAYYRPFVTASFAMIGTARAQHGFNVALHALNAALVLLLALKHGASPLRATAASVVWALHPRLVESVTWVVGRTDLACASFTLGALYAFPLDDVDDARTRRRLAFTGVLVLFALFSKEAAVAGAVALVVASVRARGTREGLRRVAPIGVAFALYVGLRLAVLADVGAAPAAVVPLAVRIEAPFETLARYALMTLRFWEPWSSRGTAGLVSAPYVVAGVAIAIAIAVAMARVLKRASIAVVAFATLGVVSLLLVVQIVPLALQGALAADRLLYLPLAGLVLALAVGVPKRSREHVLLVAAFALAAASTVVVRLTVRAFGDDVRFLVTVAERADATNTGPRSAVAAAVRDRGDSQLACDLFARSRTILRDTGRANTPAYRRATEQVGACLVRTGRVDEAVSVYRELAAIASSGRVELGLGYACLAALDFDGADGAFARAAATDPKLASLTTKLRSDVARARRQQPSLEAADHTTRARYAANAGRALDAEREWSLVAADPKALDSQRVEAMRYLALDGDLEVAKRAYEACEPCRAADPAIHRTLDGRRGMLASVAAERARIEALR